MNDTVAGIATGGSILSAGLAAGLALAGQIVAIVAGVVAIVAGLYAIQYYRSHKRKP